MTEQLRFDDKVVVVTGAGGGLGRQYAHEFARRGAKVVVNDLGCTQDGSSQSTKSADVVVSEIRSMKGEAVADYNSVEDGDKIINTAINTYGRVDVLVNNAGILRDKSFTNMSDNEWQLVHRVHLYGAFKTTNAAWRHMKSQKYGKIIMTTSNAGLYGNFGQANYSAAKMGLVGLSNTLSKEGAKYNIHCNTIAPLAGSRLTESVMPEDVFDRLKPEHVTPFVLYLCHESSSENGAVVEAAGGWGGKVRLQRALGAYIGNTQDCLTPENVSANWAKISDYNSSVYPQASGEDLMSVMEMINNPHTPKDNEQSRLKMGDLIGQKMIDGTVSYDHKDIILYSLGIGVNSNSQLESPLQYLYEGSSEFSAFPTFAVIPAQEFLFSQMTGLFSRVEPSVDLSQLLHGEQYIEWFKPMPTEGTLTLSGEISDVCDKGKGALVIADIYTKDSNGVLLCHNQFSIYLRGSGNFGGKQRSDKDKPIVSKPNRKPDVTVEEVVSTSQAALYRLNGDNNPLHIDPDFAALGGFSRPILHGLCSLGYSARHVLSKYAPGNPNCFKKIKTRFMKPVLPGQTLVTQMWREGTCVHFSTQVKESGIEVLSGGYVELDIPKQPTASPVDKLQQSEATIKSSVFFEELDQRLRSDPSLIKKVKAIFQWNITKNGTLADVWTLDFKSSPPVVHQGKSKTKADAIVTMDDEDLIKVALNQLNPQQAFASGKLKAKGNVMLLMKIGQLFRQYSKL